MGKKEKLGELEDRFIELEDKYVEVESRIKKIEDVLDVLWDDVKLLLDRDSDKKVEGAQAINTQKCNPAKEPMVVEFESVDSGSWCWYTTFVADNEVCVHIQITYLMDTSFYRGDNPLGRYFITFIYDFTGNPTFTHYVAETPAKVVEYINYSLDTYELNVKIIYPIL